MNWYIVQAYSGFEKKVVETIKEELKKHKLTDKLEDILVPTHQVTEVKKGKRTKKEKKFFPGYVLIKIDLTKQIYHMIKNLQKVSGFLGSSILSGSHKTATLFFLPEPLGKFITVLKLKSPPLDCFKLIFKEISIDSSNLVVAFFLTKSKICLGSIFLSLVAVFKISLYLLDFFFIFILLPQSP